MLIWRRITPRLYAPLSPIILIETRLVNFTTIRATFNSSYKDLLQLMFMQEYLDECIGSSTRRIMLYQVRNIEYFQDSYIERDIEKAWYLYKS